MFSPTPRRLRLWTVWKVTTVTTFVVATLGLAVAFADRPAPSSSRAFPASPAMQATAYRVSITDLPQRFIVDRELHAQAAGRQRSVAAAELSQYLAGSRQRKGPSSSPPSPPPSSRPWSRPRPSTRSRSPWRRRATARPAGPRWPGARRAVSTTQPTATTGSRSGTATTATPRPVQLPNRCSCSGKRHTSAHRRMSPEAVTATESRENGCGPPRPRP